MSAAVRIGRVVACAVIIEPMPENWNATPALLADRVQPLADLLAALVQRVRRLRRVDLAVARDARRHGQHVIVEGPRMRQGSGLAGRTAP